MGTYDGVVGGGGGGDSSVCGIIWVSMVVTKTGAMDGA